MKHSLLFLAAFWAMVAFMKPTDVACAVRAINPIATYPVWCQAKEWPKP